MWWKVGITPWEKSMSLVDSEWISEVTMWSVAWSRLQQGPLCPPCQPSPGRQWPVLPTLVPGTGRAQRCCCAGGALTGLVGQPGGLNGGGLTAEANTFSIKLAEAHIQDSKAEEKGERDRVECCSPAAPLEKVVALRKLQYHYLPYFKNHLFFFFFFKSK